MMDKKTYHAAYHAQWSAKPENKRKLAANTERWLAKNPDAARKVQRAYRRRNPGRNTAYATARKRHVARATPPWANTFFISEAYALARLRTALTGIKWNVDHIVPLRSPIVCGLHTEENLRVIPMVENCRKRNRVEEPFAVGNRPFAAAD
jgi:hypothetical protein